MRQKLVQNVKIENATFWVTFKHLSVENHILVLSARKFIESWYIEFEKQHLFSTHIFDKEFWGYTELLNLKKKRKTIIISLIWQFYFLTTFFRYVERRREEQSQQKQKRFFFSWAQHQDRDHRVLPEYSNKKFFS